MTQHTLTPWLGIGAAEYAGSSWIEITIPRDNTHSTDRRDYQEVTAKEGDAAFIVKAVNCHYELVEAVKFAFDNLQEINPLNYDHEDVCFMNQKNVEVIIALKSVLAKAKGE